ncbi:MAG TPA: class I SAM-dependent methyltransferase, partial [Parachlamydiaceae bacterium]|nr:class I SAM-dependent methyltransferase [Parachlamydiaceae bacterium]
MDLVADYQNDQPPSHYETIVFKEDMTSVVQQTKLLSFIYMDQLEGWCTRNKAAILIDMVFMLRPKTIVEIGVWGGKSLIPMAQALNTTKSGIIFGIDPWDSLASIQGMEGANYDWWGTVDHTMILQGLLEKISKFQLSGHIQLIKDTSENASPIPNIDILHIDGNHSENASMHDVNKWVPLVRNGGIIIFDDVDWITNEKAVQWLDT